MQHSQPATISNFIWNIADSVLRDLFVRGKYRDVILPMTVIHRLDAVLELTKQQVLNEKKWPPKQMDTWALQDHQPKQSATSPGAP